MNKEEKYDGLEIAIIGMSAKFPGSENIQQYWNNLVAGKEMITRFTDEELKARGVKEETLKDPSFVKAEGLIANKDHFDNGFFEYLPEEAALMDPQIRIFHEQCWKALEDAGYASMTELLKIGLFAGATDNVNFKLHSLLKGQSSSIDPFFLSQISDKTFLNTLVSYKLNLRGPALYVDTACSTSLVAAHVACRSLLMKECNIALAGGVSIRTMKKKGYHHMEGMIASSDGHCKAFDQDSDGTVPSEGAGVVVLKRLADALRDKDHIYAVIRSSAVNNDGNNKVGFTAPSVKGQADCIRMAHKLSGIEPSSVSYVEAHGTATKLGDPIEIRALNDAFAGGGKNKFCAIGSVKTNMGHLDAAAGVAGLIKAALSLKYKKIVPSLHFNKANQEIDFDGGPFYVNTELRNWERTGASPLRAGVSSFGIGGTNAHMVLQEAPMEELGNKGRKQNLLVLSAKTQEALMRYTGDLKTYLLENPLLDAADMSYTFQAGRKNFQYRRSLTFKNTDELILLLDPGKFKERIIRSRERKDAAVFMFPGQGSQYVGMGAGLYEQEPLFRSQLDKGFDILKTLTGKDFKQIMFSEDTSSGKINVTENTQPLIFIFEYALAQLIMSWGIRPRYMIGHSVGEYVAACLSGVFNYEDALKLVVRRGELMNRTQRGSMISVPLNKAAAEKYLDENISLAAVNGPEQIVMSGTDEAITALVAKLEAAGIVSIKLHTSHAFHSVLLDPVLDEFKTELQKITFNKPKLPFISNVTGNFIIDEEAISPDYWVNHVRNTVNFSAGVKMLLNQRQEFIFIETGAGYSLSGLVRQHQSEKSQPVAFNLVRHPKESDDDLKYLVDKLGQLWSHGINIDWNAFHMNEKRRRISLPSYSFEPAKYQAEVDPFEGRELLESSGLASTSYNRMKDWIYYPVWNKSVLSETEAIPGIRNFLFFSPGDELAEKFSQVLETNENKFIRVIAGKEFKKYSPNSYQIDIAESLHYTKLFDLLKEENIKVTDIIHSFCTIHAEEIFLQGDAQLHSTYYSLVAIVKELSLRNMDTPDLRLTVLTDSLHNVVGNEKIAYQQSPVLGLVNVIPQEYALFCRNLDLDLSGMKTEDYSKAAQEIISGSERIISYRYGQRWVSDYQKHSVELTSKGIALKQEGVYLITGGLGNLGFTLAEHLIRKYNAKIVITGRRKIEENVITPVQQKLVKLKTMSDHILYLNGDVADQESFLQIVTKAERTFGPVNGVIHAAGVIDPAYFELIDDTQPVNTMTVFAPKVLGIENIYKLFKDRNPDFVWITSSLASVLGGLSYAAYSAANLYMDHFVSSKRNELSNWKCINLSEMLFTEEDVAKERESARTALKPAEICELFEWSLEVKGQPVILQTVTGLDARIIKAYASKKEMYKAANASSESVHKTERPDLRTSYVAPVTETEKHLTAMLETFFGIADIGVEDDFFELGGDSLKAMVLLKRITQEFNVTYTLHDFFKSGNVKQLSESIEEKQWINKKSDKSYSSII